MGSSFWPGTVIAFCFLLVVFSVLCFRGFFDSDAQGLVVCCVPPSLATMPKGAGKGSKHGHMRKPASVVKKAHRGGGSSQRREDLQTRQDVRLTNALASAMLASSSSQSITTPSFAQPMSATPVASRISATPVADARTRATPVAGAAVSASSDASAGGCATSVASVGCATPVAAPSSSSTSSRSPSSSSYSSSVSVVPATQSAAPKAAVSRNVGNQWMDIILVDLGVDEEDL